MRRYWLVRRSPAQPPFVLMKADTAFSPFFAHLGAVSLGWLLFQWEKLKIGTLAFCPCPLWTAHHHTGCLLLPDSSPRQLGEKKKTAWPYGCIPPRMQADNSSMSVPIMTEFDKKAGRSSFNQQYWWLKLDHKGSVTTKKKKLTQHHPHIFNHVSGQNLISPFVPVVTVTLPCDRSFKAFLRYCVAIAGLIWGQNNLNLWPPTSNQSSLSPGECLQILQIMRSKTHIYIRRQTSWKANAAQAR